MCSAIRGMSEGVASDLCTSVELLSEPKKHSQDSTAKRCIHLLVVFMECAVVDLDGVPWVPWNPPFESCLRSIASVCKHSTQQRIPHLLLTCR